MNEKWEMTERLNQSKALEKEGMIRLQIQRTEREHDERWECALCEDQRECALCRQSDGRIEGGNRVTAKGFG